MRALETTAVVESPFGLRLCDPIPLLSGKKCRVILLFEETEVVKKAGIGERDALLRLADYAGPMGGMSNEEMDRVIYGV